MFFIKAHGLGNDFAIFPQTLSDPSLFDILEKNAKFICDRKYGIGCDQLIGISDNVVRFWNSDGSHAKFCGNGCRAVLKYLHSKGDSLVINTDCGIVSGLIIDNLVRIKYPNNGHVLDKDKYYLCDVGNRHAVTIGKDRMSNWDENFNLVQENGVNFMHLSNNSGKWFMDIYEFGVGETNACGSGCMAAFLVLEKLHNLTEVDIEMKGGTLIMERTQNNLYQSGPAEIVFEGKIDLE